MPRPRLYLQSEAQECGLACLAMVLSAYDRASDLSTLRRRFTVGTRGVTVKELGGMAEALGFAHRALRGEPHDLHQLKLPAVLHWELNHFLVLVKIGRSGCVLLDPARGRVRASWDEIRTHFTGVALELWPTADFTGLAGAKPLGLLDLWRRIAPGKATIVRIVVISALLQCMILAGPWQVQWAVDEALASGDTHLLTVLAVGFGGLAVLQGLAHWLRGALVVSFGHQLSFQFGSSLVHHLLHLPAEWFGRRHSADVLSRFGSLAPVRELVTHGAAAFVVDVAMVVLSGIAMVLYEFRLAAIVVVTSVCFLCAYLAFVPRLKRLGTKVVVADAAQQAHLLESTRSIQGIKVSGQVSKRIEQWRSLHAETLGHSLALERSRVSIGTMGLLVSGLELTLIVYLGSHAVLEQVFTVGMLYAFLSYRSHFSERMRSLVEQLVQLKTLRVHLARLEDIWSEPAERADEHVTRPRGNCCSTIELRGVGFRYSDNSRWIFRGLDLDVQDKQFIAVVGTSGVGKTTLLRLLTCLSGAVEGELSIGGTQVTAANRAILRREIACVLQEDGLFAGSVAQNVTLFERPDFERLDAIVARVGLDGLFRELPMGYATRIGDAAAGFSSGQIQRLLLARALYQSRPILVLDEGTANLDVVSAHAIQELVATLDCTRVVVTHDLGFARMADRVFELTPEGLIERRVGKRSGAVVSE